LLREGRFIRGFVLTGAFVLAGCWSSTRRDGSPAPSAGEADSPFLKGQLHVHTAESKDADTAPEDVVDWYAAQGYDFVVLTDHNAITEVSADGDMLVFPGVELTTPSDGCDPPPEPGAICMIHVNALFVDTPERGHYPWEVTEPERIRRYELAVDETLKIGALPMLNHPTFHHSADETLVSTLGAEGVPLIELFNQRTPHSNEGDEAHLSTEEMWDYVLGTGVEMWGVAVDDAHHVADDELNEAGRGWVSVRASRDGAAIRAALERGDFYSSTGVELSRLEVEDGWLELAVTAATPHASFRFIGSGGNVLAEVRGRGARFRLAAASDYVRVVVTDDQGRHAWTQPVR